MFKTELSFSDVDSEAFYASYGYDLRGVQVQEPGAGAVKTYPRVVDGVVREGDMRRAEARARKKQRKAELEAKQQAEVQRQKNATRRDIETRSFRFPLSAATCLEPLEVYLPSL